jgi:polar amino acid transport system ATP-binding protein
VTQPLDIDGVSAHYGTTRVLENLSLSVQAGELVSLLGASGCGKTTTLRLIAGFLAPSGGSIRLGGRDLTRLPTHRRDIGLVFQNYALFPHLSVLDNVTLAPTVVHGRPRDEVIAEARALLDRIGLSDKAGEYPDRLSGGQQQRVAIVRALAVRPRVLLLDEITSALDPELVGEVLGLVREVAAQGMTILMATHEMAFACQVADTVAFLDQGVLLESGPPEQVLAYPAEPRTRRFLARVIDAGRL